MLICLWREPEQKDVSGCETMANRSRFNFFPQPYYINRATLVEAEKAILGDLRA